MKPNRHEVQVALDTFAELGPEFPVNRRVEAAVSAAFAQRRSDLRPAIVPVLALIGLAIFVFVATVIR